MGQEEQAEETEDDEAEDTTTTGFLLATNVLTRRSIFSRTASSAAGPDPSE